MSRAFAGRDFDMSMIIITYHSLENYNLKLLSSLSPLQITHKHIQSHVKPIATASIYGLEKLYLSQCIKVKALKAWWLSSI